MTRPSYFNSVRDRRAKTLTPAALSALVTSEQTRRGMAEIDRLQQAGQDIRPGKEMLSVVTWGARYPEGEPRIMENARSTGLFFIDCDHLTEDPRTVYQRLMAATSIGDAERRQSVAETLRQHVKGAHVTPSGQGLRLILTHLLPDRDNAQNIEAFRQLVADDPAAATIDTKVKDIGQALGGEVLGEVALHLERVVLVSFSIIWLKLISRTVPGSLYPSCLSAC